jgi:hypothetical protein
VHGVDEVHKLIAHLILPPASSMNAKNLEGPILLAVAYGDKRASA